MKVKGSRRLGPGSFICSLRYLKDIKDIKDRKVDSCENAKESEVRARLFFYFLYQAIALIKLHWLCSIQQYIAWHHYALLNHSQRYFLSLF